MSYGELQLPPVRMGVNKQNGRFMRGHVPANKGKKWSEYMGKRAQKRAARGWVNLDLHRNKNGRPDTSERFRKKVVAVMDDGSWLVFPFLVPAAEWIGGSRENVGRCCRMNGSKKELHKPNGKPTGRVNTDHRYMGVRFYFESDDIWLKKIK